MSYNTLNFIHTFTNDIVKLESDEIFLFGSNTEGRHGKGAAKIAHDKFGAMYGNAYGLQGQSYAIVTKNLRAENTNQSIDLNTIHAQVTNFLLFAEKHLDPWLTFYVTKFGSSLAGYSENEIASLFVEEDIPPNVILNIDYARIIQNQRNDIKLIPWNVEEDIFNI